MVHELLMATRRHRIVRYHLSIDVAQGGVPRLEAWGAADRKVADLGCLDNGTSLPAPRIAPDLSSATAFIHAGALPALLDLLRHETAVLCLDDTAPGFVTFETLDPNRRTR